MSADESETAAVRQQPGDLEVAAYLKRNPDFFLRHSHLLADLVVPHVSSGRALSLLEKQVAVLREQQAALRRRVAALIETATGNERLLDQFQELFVWLAAVRSGAELRSRLPGWIEDRFRLARVTLVLFPPESERDRTWQPVLERLHRQRTVCDDRLPSAVLARLFGESSATIRSCALVPLRIEGARKPAGVLALGAREADHYRPTMETRFLDNLGRLVGATLDRVGRDG